MKSITIFAVLFFFSVTAFAQTTHADSVRIAAAQNKAIEEIQSTSIKDFNQWMYENVPAKQYNDFANIYNAYMKIKFGEWQQKEAQSKTGKK